MYKYALNPHRLKKKKKYRKKSRNQQKIKMKFIYLLFLLTTLIAVALSQQIPTNRRVKIRSIVNGLFWVNRRGVGVTLEPEDSVGWTIHRKEDNHFTISPFVGLFGEYVQDNGLDKQLTVKFYGGADPSQEALWQFKPHPKPLSFRICHYRQRSLILDCATADDGKVIVKEKVSDSHQLWEIIPEE